MNVQLKNEHARIMAEIQVKQENFVRKERAFTAKIEELERQVLAIKDKRRSWMSQDKNIIELKKMHSEVQEKVGLVQVRTAKLVQDQEQELLRAFKQRLSDVQAELETEKMGSTQEGGIMAWMEKSKAFEYEAARERQRADKEDKIFTTRTKEKQMLDVHLNLQGEDRAQLIKQLVAVKKHNAALRASLKEYQEEKSSLLLHLKDTLHTPKMRGDTSILPPEADKMPRESAETRYGEVLKSLTRMLTSERKAEVSTLAAIEEHNESILDLERTLRKCVDEVASSLKGVERRQVESFKVEDREKALEMWLTMDGVLDHLCTTRSGIEPPPVSSIPSHSLHRDDIPDIKSPSPRLLPPLM